MNQKTMVHKPSYTDISCRSFLIELEILLKVSGIERSMQSIQAEIDDGKNRFTPSTEKDTPKVGRVILYMEEHLSEELSLDELADEIELSKYQLIRRFRKEEGTTPWKYLIRKRIERAKKLLEHGIPPGQVATDVGFYDQSHLNKIFREKTGYTPKEYQEENFINRN